MKHQAHKQHGGEMLHFADTSTLQTIIEGNQGRNREAGVEATRGFCLHDCSLWFAQTAFLYHPGPLAWEWEQPQYIGPVHINH